MPSFPAEPSDLSQPPVLDEDVEAGTIAYVTARLSRWARIAPPGMAYATFESSLAREAVIKGMTDALTPDAIPVQHVALERELPAIDHVRRLMNDVLPGASGILHVTGFQYAFTAEETVTEALRLFNYNRENLVNFPVQQVWWMTPEFAMTFENTVPELARYFLISVRLTETIRPAADTMTFEMLPEGQRLSPQEARQLSRINRERFENAIKQPLTITEAVRLACDAFEPLLQAGLITEASTMWAQAVTRIQSIGLPIQNYVNADANFVPMTNGDGINLITLASLYEAQGLYNKAEPLYVQSLTICEQVLGTTHSGTATVINNLAGLYESQKLYDKAEPLYVQALAIHERVLGAIHPNTAATLNNLAGLYKSQGLYDKAEPLYLRALAIQEQLVSAMHPDTARVLNNLAVLYKLQKLYDKSEMLHMRALAIYEQVFGTMHYDTAKSFNNLAVLYKSQGLYDKAEPLYLRSLAIYKAVAGKDHPYTLGISNNLDIMRKEILFLEQQNKVTPSKLPVMATIKPNKPRGKKSR